MKKEIILNKEKKISLLRNVAEEKTDEFYINRFYENPFNIVVGANGSGKSRLLEIIKELPDLKEKVLCFDFAKYSTDDIKVELKEIENIDDYLRKWIIEEHFDNGMPPYILTTENVCGLIKILSESSAQRSVQEQNIKCLNAIRENFKIFFNINIEDKTEHKNLLDYPYFKEFLDNYKDKSPGERLTFCFILYISIFQNKKDKYYILIDEPENHLHYDKVHKFIELIKGIQANSKLHFWIATHSPYLIFECAFEEIIFIKDGIVQNNSSNTKYEIIELLQGPIAKNHMLYDMYSDEFCNFVAECILSPEVSDNPDYSAYKNLKNELEKLNLKDKYLLDFSAGSGRLAGFFNEFGETENYSKTYCYAYGYPDKNNEEFMQAYKSELEKRYAKAYIGQDYNVIEKPANGYSSVFMVNVLHEIPIDSWKAAFDKICDTLDEDGVFIICETMVLTVGEKVDEDYSFLVLTNGAIKELFDVDSETNEKGTVIYAIIKKQALKNAVAGLNSNKIKKVLEKIALNAFEKYHVTPETDSRKRAFYAVQYINAIKTKSDRNILKESGTEEKADTGLNWDAVH